MRPILFTIHLGGLKIPIFSYGFMLALSFILGTWIAARRGEKFGFPRDEYYNTTLAVMIGVLIGARLLYVLTTLHEFARNPLDIFAVWKGGLVLYGGLIGGALAAFYYLRKKRLDPATYFDVGAPSVGLGLVLTRIGCFLNGCCFGKPTLLFIGIEFPRNSKPFFQHVAQHLIDPSAPHSLPIYPTQLISSFNGLIIFLFLSYMLQRRKFPWQIWLLLLIYYCVTRFLIEFLRGDKIRGFVGPLSTSQFISLFIFPASVALYFHARRYYMQRSKARK